MRNFFCLGRFRLLLLGIPVAGCLLAQSPKPTDWGQWWQFRGDRRLTGRARMPGTIRTTPQVLWSQFIGIRNTWIALTPNAGSSISANLPVANVPSGSVSYQGLLQQWGVRGPLYDLDGNGRLTQIPPSTGDKIGKFSSGFQRVHFDSTFNICGTIAGTCGASGNLSGRSNGTWVQLWQSVLIPDLFIPNPIVGDFDNDGALEVAVTPWHDMYVFDLETGTLKQKATFDVTGQASGRAYGWFGAKDLTGDGKAEFVILGDFENKIAVMGWSGATIVKLWDHLIERGIDNKQSVLHPGVDPLQDIDGDGLPEIVVSIYNESGDNLWHVVAFQGANGKVVLDLPGEHLDGLADVNGDGVAELLLSAAPAERLPDTTAVRLVSFKGGKVAELWSAKGTAFQTVTLQDIPLNINSGAATGWTTALIGKPAGDQTRPFFTRRGIDRSQDIWEVSVWRPTSANSVALLGTAQGPGLNVIGTKPVVPGAASILLEAAVPRSAPGQYSVQGFGANVIYSETNSGSLSIPVIAALSAGSKPSVVVQTLAGNQIVAIQPGVRVSTGQPKILWSHPGRGHYSGHTGYTGVSGFGGVVLADLFGNSSIATLLATTGPTGQARLSAIAPDGTELWNADFDRFPGAVPLWNNGGLLAWLPGRFRYPDRDDVLISLRRSSQHSEELWLLDGRTGATVWSRAWGPTPVPGGVTGDGGGGWMAVYDWNGDGLDEAVNFTPNNFWVADGTGKNLVDGTFSNGLFPGISTFYGLPLAEDFFVNGTFTLAYGGSSYALGLLTPTGRQIWRTTPDVRPPGFTPAIADLNGDGNLAVVSVGQLIPDNSSQSNIVARDAKTGAQLWSVPINAPPFDASGNPANGSPSAAISADINGDGRDEIIFTAGNTLFAIGASANGTSGRILWQITLPGSLGMPSIGDASGDGRLQVVVVCGDGNIYGIGDGSPARALQTIRFNALSDRGVESDAFTVSATATSGLPVSFVSDTNGICSVSGNTVTLRSAGICTILASQAGNSSFNPATTVARSFKVQFSSPSYAFSVVDRGGTSLVSAGTSSSTLVGYGGIQPNSGSAVPAGLAIFAFRQNNVLVTEASVPATPLIQQGRIYSRLDSAVNTGIAIANPNSQPATISFFFTDSNGNNFGDGTATISPNSQIAAFLTDPPFNGSRSIAGTFTFTSSVPVAAIALQGLVNERNDFLLTTLPVTDLSQPSSSGTVFFPHFATGGGWGTQVILINPTDRPLSGSVQFSSQGSAAAGATPVMDPVAYFIQARGMWRLDLSSSSSTVTVGSIRAIPGAGTATPSGLAVFSFRNGGVTVSQASVPASTAGTAFRMYAEASGSAGNSGLIETGLAVTNPSANPVTVTLELTNLDGSQTGLTGTISVSANGQVATFLNQIQGFSSLQLPFRGVLRLSSSVSIAVAGLRGRYNERGDFLITTTAPINEGSSPVNSALFFPHLADSGGYTTQFILFSGLPGQSSSGTLQLFTQSGDPLSLPLQ